MTSRKGPAKGTRVQDGRYYLVRAEGRKRVWVKLTRVDDGLPAFYAALAEALAAPAVVVDLMPQVISAWETDVMAEHAEKTQKDERARGKVIAAEFAEFTAAEMNSEEITNFLKQFRNRPRTHNAYRAQIGELMRYAIQRTWREVGSNPVFEVIKTMSTPPRDRYPTDSELRRIKVAGIYATVRSDAKPGAARQRNRSGLMLAALIDMAYLTGQRISDLLKLEWDEIGRQGIQFKPGKTEGSTGVSVLIQWTLRLKDVERRLKALRKEIGATGTYVFTQLNGERYTYWGASSLWRRARKRAGIADCRFNDMRAKAITDTEEAYGMQAARRKGAHSTEAQTADYVRHKKPQKSRATR